VPPDDDIRDPRAFRWVETGVSGLARQREWDATAIVEVPELRATEEAEIEFRLLGDGSVIGDVAPGVLAELKDEGRVVPVEVEGLPGDRLIHADDLPLLDRLEAGEWEPRTTLLSPFDNLICDRDRTESLFGFRFRLEIYVPKAKREFGFFVMPVLDGDRLVARADPAFDRRSRTLTINALHWESGTRLTKALERRVRRAIEELGHFLSASEIVFPSAASRARAGP